MVCNNNYWTVQGFDCTPVSLYFPHFWIAVTCLHSSSYSSNEDDDRPVSNVLFMSKLIQIVLLAHPLSI